MENNQRIRVFCQSRLGASHVKSGKPCQDASIAWQSDDGLTHIVVTADGHGGDTYVRSDVGARLATEIALQHLRQLIEKPDFAAAIAGRKGAVTARPEGPRKMPVNPADRSESQQELFLQDQLFARQIAGLKEQDPYFQQLFAGILQEWRESIAEDSSLHPFTDAEKTLLGQNRVEKAYGCTLLAFARTQDYWIAFHLGDGKMLATDAVGQWTEPVPWDCTCFLNMTTSLCNKNPLPSFRYAFDATGHFPAAVILGSDGLDDSWGTMEKLQRFYTKTLINCYEYEKEGKGFNYGVEELGDYLEHKLSPTGSRDDMTVAGIVDLTCIGAIRQLFLLREQGAKLKMQRDERLKELQEMQAKADEEVRKLREDMQRELADIQRKAEAEMAKRQQELKSQIDARVQELHRQVESRRQEIESENAQAQTQFAALRQQADMLKQQTAAAVAVAEAPQPVPAEAATDAAGTTAEVSDTTAEASDTTAEVADSPAEGFVIPPGGFDIPVEGESDAAEPENHGGNNE